MILYEDDHVVVETGDGTTTGAFFYLRSKEKPGLYVFVTHQQEGFYVDANPEAEMVLTTLTKNQPAIKIREVPT